MHKQHFNRSLKTIWMIFCYDYFSLSLVLTFIIHNDISKSVFNIRPQIVCGWVAYDVVWLCVLKKLFCLLSNQFNCVWFSSIFLLYKHGKLCSNHRINELSNTIDPKRKPDRFSGGTITAKNAMTLNKIGFYLEKFGYRISYKNSKIMVFTTWNECHN